MSPIFGPIVNNPRMHARIVSVDLPLGGNMLVRKPGWIAKLWARFLEDCRDFRLWFKGIEPRDEYLAYEMMAEMAKIPESDFDIDAWEAERFAAHPNAVWFDPDRYKDTPYDWVKKPKPKKVEKVNKADELIRQIENNNYSNQIGSLAALQNAYAAQGHHQSAYAHSNLSKLHQAQFGISASEFENYFFPK